MRRKLLTGCRWLPMLLVMTIIFAFSDQPGDTLRLPSLPGIDKIAHLFAYGVLAASIIFAFNDHFQTHKPSAVGVLTVLICFFYGVSDEFHQSFVPGRSVSGFDVLADTSGALLVYFFWWKVKKHRPGHLEKEKYSRVAL